MIPTQDSVADGSPKFVNEEGMTIYRHQGYWYNLIHCHDDMACY